MYHLRMLRELQREYGHLAGVQSHYNDCLKNAAHNAALALHLGMRAQILFVKTDVGSHAYLSDGRKAYSRDLTWMTSYYPELSLRDIARLNGQDVTNLVFWQALQITDDVHRHHVVIDTLSRYVPEVVATLRGFFQDS